jgi:hypothetical protein
MECIRLGLGSTEECLRGGNLDGPVLLTNLKTLASGAKFVRLAKDDKQLSVFLTGKGRWTRALSNTLVFENLARARNDIVNKLFAQLATEGAAQSDSQEPGEPDDVAGLGLDEAPTTAPVKAKRPRKIAIFSQMPEAVSVEYPGSDWIVDVLPEANNKAVHMALTDENMKALYQLVQLDLAGGEVKRPRF